MSKSLLVIALLVLGACSQQSQTNPCSNGGISGTAQYNSQTVTLVNGLCSATYTEGTVTYNSQNYSVQEATICGDLSGYIYQGKLYDPAMPNNSSPIGLGLYSDDYYVIPQGQSTQCWYQVQNGELNPNASNPNF